MDERFSNVTGESSEPKSHSGGDGSQEWVCLSLQSLGFWSGTTFDKCSFRENAAVDFRLQESDS